MSEAKKIKIVVVDDHFVVRVGLVQFLNDQPDVEVVADAKDCNEAIAAFRRTKPDVVLTDMKLPGTDGVGVTKALRAIDPNTRVLVLSSYDTEQDVVAALAAGASGFVLKEEDGGELLNAIRVVAAGGSYVTPALSRHLQPDVESAGIDARERKMLELFCRGLDTAEAGKILGLQPSTTRVYASRLYVKLGVSNKTEAVAVAIKRGIVRQP
jgi:DNA-binding NarL/FixJ family response regulator